VPYDEQSMAKVRALRDESEESAGKPRVTKKPN
jgi:hypothetical protein